jgi:hypothetical protein
MLINAFGYCGLDRVNLQYSYFYYICLYYYTVVIFTSDFSSLLKVLSCLCHLSQCGCAVCILVDSAPSMRTQFSCSQSKKKTQVGNPKLDQSYPGYDTIST